MERTPCPVERVKEMGRIRSTEQEITAFVGDTITRLNNWINTTNAWNFHGRPFGGENQEEGVSMLVRSTIEILLRYKKYNSRIELSELKQKYNGMKEKHHNLTPEGIWSNATRMVDDRWGTAEDKWGCFCSDMSSGGGDGFLGRSGESLMSNLREHWCEYRGRQQDMWLIGYSGMPNLRLLRKAYKEYNCIPGDGGALAINIRNYLQIWLDLYKRVIPEIDDENYPASLIAIPTPQPIIEEETKTTEPVKPHLTSKQKKAQRLLERQERKKEANRRSRLAPDGPINQTEPIPELPLLVNKCVELTPQTNTYLIVEIHQMLKQLCAVQIPTC